VRWLMVLTDIAFNTCKIYITSNFKSIEKHHKIIYKYSR
jgi:hypothetical protein